MGVSLPDCAGCTRPYCLGCTRGETAAQPLDLRYVRLLLLDWHEKPCEYCGQELDSFGFCGYCRGLFD